MRLRHKLGDSARSHSSAMTCNLSKKEIQNTFCVLGFGNCSLRDEIEKNETSSYKKMYCWITFTFLRSAWSLSHSSYFCVVVVAVFVSLEGCFTETSCRRSFLMDNTFNEYQIVITGTFSYIMYTVTLQYYRNIYRRKRVHLSLYAHRNASYFVFKAHV